MILKYILFHGLSNFKMLPHIIEINPTELCNRKCSFCPRGLGYPNLNLNLSIEDTELIHEKLLEFDYRGNLHLTGSGEPTLNPNFLQILKILRKNKNIILKMTTNGDFIGKKNFSFFEFFDEVRISIYDGDDRYEFVKKETKKYNVVIRKQYDSKKSFNNRGGWFDDKNKIDKTCYIPFYKMYIDWNLDIRLCANDWKQKKILGNLKNNSLKELWNESFREIRKNLIVDGRKNLNPCKDCNVNGTINKHTNKIEGIEHYNFFRNYYDT